MLNLPLLGQRVALRRLRPEDLRAFQAYRQDPQVGRYQGWQAQPDEQALAFLSEMAAAPALPPGDWWQLGIATRTDDGLVGDIGLHLAADGGELEFGFSLARAAQGHGLAREALALLTAALFAARPGLRRIVAITDARNGPAQRLLERLGFAHVATEPALFRGEPCEELRYELARPAGA